MARRRQGRDPLDALMSLTAGYKRIDAREQDFYGLGPNTTLSGQAGYGLLLSNTYVNVDYPFSAWNSFGIHFSFLQPRVTSTINASIPQLRAAYNGTSAPGLNSHDDFLRYEPYSSFAFPRTAVTSPPYVSATPTIRTWETAAFLFSGSRQRTALTSPCGFHRRGHLILGRIGF